MSLLLFQLRDELTRLSNLRGSTDTNVESIRMNDWGQLEFDATPHSVAEKLTDRETEVKALEDEVKSLNEQVVEAEKSVKDAEEKTEKALRTLDDMVDVESGLTVKDMMERMEHAETEAEAARQNSRDWAAQDKLRETELKAIRARKGIGPKVIANLANITRFLDLAARGNVVSSKDAADLLARLTEKD